MGATSWDLDTSLCGQRTSSRGDIERGTRLGAGRAIKEKIDDRHGPFPGGGGGEIGGSLGWLLR